MVSQSTIPFACALHLQTGIVQHNRSTPWEKVKNGFLESESVCPLQLSKSPKSGKEGFRVKQNPFPATPEKGALNQKSSISIQGTSGKIGISC